MAQNGTLVKDHGAWYLRYYEGKKRRKIWLGRIADYPTERLIKGRLEEERARLRERTSTPGHNSANLSLTLERYIEEYFLTDARRKNGGPLRASTLAGYRGLFARYVKDRDEAQARLWVIEPHHIQWLLDGVAEDSKRILCKTTISHFKAFLSRVFNHARNRGFYRHKNPVKGTELPTRSKRSRETGFYTLEEIQLTLPQLALPHRAAVAIAGYAGFRRAEIQGLRWEDYDSETLEVTETQWRGHRNAPKSEASASFVPVITPLRAILDAYRATTSGEGDMFPVADRGGSDHEISMDLDHVGRRDVKNAMKRVGLDWRGWHAFRRGLASNLYELGVSEKVVQRILRHSRVTITRDRYIKVRDPLVSAAMAGLEQAVNANRPAIVGPRASSNDHLNRRM